MSELRLLKCEACRGDAAKATDDEKATWMPQLPEWQIVEEQLTRTFRFKNFTEALAFTVRVGEAAEEQDHHPSLLTEWGQVTVRWWTHKIHGLHRNDFIMAALTDALYSA